MRSAVLGYGLAAAAALSAFASCLAQAPSAGNVAWIPIEKYPPAAISSREEGLSEVVIKQDQSGLITDCQLSSSSGHPTLDDAGCFLLKGSRTPVAPFFGDRMQIYWHLTPHAQTNSDGGAIPISPTWRITLDDYLAFPEVRKKGRRRIVQVIYDINEGGHATNCQGQSSDGSQQIAAAICRIFERRARFISAVGASGPVATKGSQTFRFD